MHESAEYLRWIVVLPLLGAVLNGLLNRRLSERLVSVIGIGSVAAAFGFALKAFFALRALPASERVLHDFVYSWIPIGDLQVDVAFSVDALSAAMLLLVTGVGLLIHIYSVGYMHGDKGYGRYFAYLNLFVFSMLILITADNLLLLFVGWEGVGLCSYLLIGFWFNSIANSAAGKKAFIVNRIGDFGFLIGIFVIVRALMGHVEDGTNLLAFSTMAEHADLLAPVATLAGLLLFVGATGKSAQIPLFVWLPDAMAGPTPVSALIHAATMVTAGVYMMARMSFLYDLAPVALTVVAFVGGATALFAATIGLAQTDIKKVLAYSTVSQLGYMFLACGVGAYGVGIFHVLTHAFFKALLFLGAGSVILGMHHEQDMRKMGGLRKHMPLTFGTMMAATLAISGVFPFAGFFSKDEILYKAWLESPALWVLGFLAAGLTAFYMARLMALTFFGECRAPEETKKHLHESPWSMVGPLVVLGVLSLIGGWMGWPEFLGGGNVLHHWLAPVFEHGGGHGASLVEAAHQGAETAHEGGHSVVLEWTLALLSMGWALLGLFGGFFVYLKKPELPAQARAWMGGLPHRLIENKYYVDEIYDTLIVWPLHRLSEGFLWRFVDVVIIDGLIVNGVSRFIGLCGQLLRLVQNGLLRWYAYSFATGVLVIVVYVARRYAG